METRTVFLAGLAAIAVFIWYAGSLPLCPSHVQVKTSLGNGTAQGTYTRVSKPAFGRTYFANPSGLHLFRSADGTSWHIGNVMTGELLTTSVGDASGRLPWNVPWPETVHVFCR